MRNKVPRRELPVGKAFRCTQMDTHGKQCEARQEMVMRRRDGTESGLCMPCSRRERALRSGYPGRFEPVTFRQLDPRGQLTKY